MLLLLFSYYFGDASHGVFPPVFLQPHEYIFVLFLFFEKNVLIFHKKIEIFEKKRYDKAVLNTICSATEERQMEARQIACEADTMIVIGGRHSSNTQKLYEICRKECENTYYIQTLVDLDTKPFQCIGCVGITAGASTPNNIIEEVQKHVRIKF